MRQRRSASVVSAVVLDTTSATPRILSVKRAVTIARNRWQFGKLQGYDAPAPGRGQG